MKVQTFFQEREADPEEWFKGVKGKHRLVFDCTEPKEIFPFAWPKIYMMTNAATGASKDATAVVVLRHDALLLPSRIVCGQNINSAKYLKSMTRKQKHRL